MIFVSAGTNETPFDRLVQAAAALNGSEDLLVQYGSSQVAHGRGLWRDFLPFEEMRAAMASARVVVAHAGVGSILLARSCGKRPIVMPRRADHGEAVDNHQVTFARKLDELGMVMVVEDVPELEVAIAEIPGGRLGDGWDHAPGRTLTQELRQFLTEHAVPANPIGTGNGAHDLAAPREPSRSRAA